MITQNLRDIQTNSDIKFDAAGLDDLTIIVVNKIGSGHCLQVAWKAAGSEITDVVVSRGRATTLIIPANKPIKLIYDGRTGVTVSQ